MKADRDDAPEWLTSRPSKGSNLKVVLAGVIGTAVTLGVLTLAGQAFMENTVKNLAANSQQPKPTPVAEITRSEPTPRNDWDKIVEQQARRDAMSQEQREQTTGSNSPAVKQTVFNDQNYTPRGADNVLSSREAPRTVPQEQPKEKLRVTVIKEERKLKDFCGGKEGSIERRNCKSHIGLENRN
ncbi:hypothetical protein H3221_018580 [Pseudomonas sp. LMG 31766]|uniref:Uncharacterized protein n=1 Tax=Pseudomonas chaetocerotis TaxID=2758695 RepID=A0A931GAS9_9PSED|nr:hypothetical protein [Pseudomonas chaetocerotis]MBZ9666749.1 hypothetical protein [Pseudomonas chaetocerotis]